jgi:hypothetical protein
VFQGLGEQLNPKIDGKIVVWQDHRLGDLNTDIWMTCVGRLTLSADLNGDCRVDFEDLAILAEQWMMTAY